MAQFPITEILTDNVWVDNKPVIKEFHPTGNPVVTRDRRSFKKFKIEDDPQLQFLLRFKRILIIRSISRDAIDQSLARTHENDASLDTFRIIMKTGSYKDTNDIFNTIRDIILAQNTAGNYPWWDVGNAVDSSLRAKFAREFDVLAFRSGTVRDHSELILNEAFTYDDDTTPDAFTPAWDYTLSGIYDPDDLYAKVLSNLLQISDLSITGNVVLRTPVLQDKFNVNVIKFSLKPIISESSDNTDDEWEFRLLDSGSNILFTLYYHYDSSDNDNPVWGFRWAAGNDGYTRVNNIEVDLEIQFNNTVVSLWIDDVAVFEDVAYDTAGTTAYFEIVTVSHSTQKFLEDFTYDDNTVLADFDPAWIYVGSVIPGSLECTVQSNEMRLIDASNSSCTIQPPDFQSGTNSISIMIKMDVISAGTNLANTWVFRDSNGDKVLDFQQYYRDNKWSFETTAYDLSENVYYDVLMYWDDAAEELYIYIDSELYTTLSYEYSRTIAKVEVTSPTTGGGSNKEIMYWDDYAEFDITEFQLSSLLNIDDFIAKRIPPELLS